MTDYVFGVSVPAQDVSGGSFPRDPDFGFKRVREFKTLTHRFSPLLSQRYVLMGAPTIRFQLGFAVAKGDLQSPLSKYYEIWDFFNERRARGEPFHFYDPTYWSRYSDPYYRDNAFRRWEFEGTVIENGVTFTKYLGRHLCLFDEDEMSAEAFERKMRRMDLRLVGYESFSDA